MKMFQVVVGGKFNIQVNLIFNYKKAVHTFFLTCKFNYILFSVGKVCHQGKKKILLSEQWYQVLTNAFLFLVVI